MSAYSVGKKLRGRYEHQVRPLEAPLPIREELPQPARIVRQRFEQIAGLAGVFREVKKILLELVAVLAPEVFQAALADGLPGAVGAA